MATRRVEGSTALEWLFATLSGTAELSALVTGVYRDHAPQGIKFPYAIVWQAGSEDINTGGERALSHVTRGVKVISDDGDQEQEDASSQAIDIIDRLLANVSTVAGGILLTIKSGGEIDYAESAVGGTYYRHRGRFWRMTTAALPDQDSVEEGNDNGTDA